MRTMIPAALAALALAAGTGADILWDQTDFVSFDTFTSPVDQEFPDTGTHSTYIWNDFTVPVGTPWQVSSVSTYFTRTPHDGAGIRAFSLPLPPVGPAFNGWAGFGAVTARFALVPKFGPLPGENPMAMPVVPVSLTPLTTPGGLTYWEVTATLQDVVLAPGDYWVGLTPIFSFGGVGQEYHIPTLTMLGGETVLRNPFGGFALPTSTQWGPWSNVEPGLQRHDSAVRIGGQAIPAPAPIALLPITWMFARRRGT